MLLILHQKHCNRLDKETVESVLFNDVQLSSNSYIKEI